MAIENISTRNGFDPEKMAQTIFKKTDTNGDGSLDKTELQAANKKYGGPSAELILSKADKNSDGKLTETELKDSLSQMTKNRPTTGKPEGAEGRPPGGPPPGAGSKGQAGAAQSTSSDNTVYDKKDTNKDGVVDAQEELDYAIDHPEIKTIDSGMAQGTSNYTSQGNKTKSNDGSSTFTITA